VAAHVASILGQLGVRYSIGGSLASSVSDEPRSTLDVDIVVALEESHVASLIAALDDASTSLRCARARRTCDGRTVRSAREHERELRTKNPEA
jgi:hypothetical protein